MPPTSRGSGDQVQLQQQLLCLAGNPIVSSLVGWMPNHFSRNHLYWISFQTLCFSVAASIRFLCFNTISRSMPLSSTSYSTAAAFLYPISISLIHSNRIRNDQKDLVFFLVSLRLLWSHHHSLLLHSTATQLSNRQPHRVSISRAEVASFNFNLFAYIAHFADVSQSLTRPSLSHKSIL